MNSFLILALAVLGVASAGVIAPLGIAETFGPTVSETVVSPFHRTDSIAGPCSKTVVHTTRRAGFLGNGLIGRGSGFLSGPLGVFPGAFNGGLTGFNNGIVGSYGTGVVGGALGNSALVQGALAHRAINSEFVHGGLMGGAYSGGYYGCGNELI